MKQEFNVDIEGVRMTCGFPSHIIRAMEILNGIFKLKKHYKVPENDHCVGRT